MPTRDTNWPAGTPNWVELLVPDAEAARAFYGELFGWEFMIGGEESGYYSQGSLDGHTVAGIGMPMAGQDPPPPAWTTYLASDDAAATAQAITAAGGTIFVPPMEVMGFGHMTVAADPTGCVFGVWQGLSHTGIQRYNEPGCVIWNEAHVLDFAAATDFYVAAFGYTTADLGGGDFHYVTLEVDGETVGGVGDSSDGTAEWLTYFAATDPDAMAARAVELGGRVLVEPRDSPFGRIVELAGPTGERFALITPTPPSTEG